MRKSYLRRGQSATEYAVLAGLIATALITMNLYIKRSIQGKIRDLAEQITPREEHYEPGFTDSSYVTDQSGTTVYNYSQGVSRVYQDGREGSTPENTTRSGYEEISPSWKQP